MTQLLCTIDSVWMDWVMCAGLPNTTWKGTEKFEEPKGSHLTSFSVSAVLCEVNHGLARQFYLAGLQEWRFVLLWVTCFSAGHWTYILWRQPFSWTWGPDRKPKCAQVQSIRNSQNLSVWIYMYIHMNTHIENELSWAVSTVFEQSNIQGTCL